MHILKLLNWLVRSLCQSCRPLSRQKRCPGWRWIYFAPLVNNTLRDNYPTLFFLIEFFFFNLPFVFHYFIYDNLLMCVLSRGL